MHKSNPRCDKKDVGIHEVYAIANETRGEEDIYSMIAQAIIYEKAKDSYFRQVSSAAGYPGSMYNYDRNGVVTRRASVDGVTQKAAGTSHWARLLYPAQYPTLASHAGERGMYDSMWK